MPTYLQPLYEESSTRSMTASFFGLNRRLRIGEGELYDMRNLTSDHVPLLAVRERRYIPTDLASHSPSAIVADVEGASTCAWLDGKTFYFDKDDAVDLSDYITETDERRQIIKYGAYLIILPDMVYLNTVNHSDVGVIKDELVTPSLSTTMASVCDYEGNPPTFSQVEKPESNETVTLKNGDTWLRTGNEPELSRYDDETGEWYRITSYLKISVTSDSKTVTLSLKTGIRPGDAIRIKVRGSAALSRLDGVHVVQGVTRYVEIDEDGNEIAGDEEKISAFWIEGIYSGPSGFGSTYPVAFSREVPRMDFVCEAGNRLWGCRYGESTDGAFVNEIYCSARGDFYRWIKGDAENDDSPVTFSVGLSGPFTGAVNYQGFPTFFKRNAMLVVRGYGASGFSLYDTPCSGVQEGAGASTAVINNILYYKSETAVMAYDGSTPVSVSDKLGRLSSYNRAVGGACGGKYYLSVWQDNGGVSNPSLLVLDTETGLWHKEDETECADMATSGDNLFFVNVQRKKIGEEEEITRSIRAVRVPESLKDTVADKDKETTQIQWMAETGIIGLETADAKYITKLAIRLRLDAGSTVRVMVQYNSTGLWKQIGATDAPTMRTVTMPVMPARCDHMRLRLEGVGGCKVYSITKKMENAEEV